MSHLTFVTTNVTVTHRGETWPADASLTDRHRMSGHRHVWRCCIAIVFYRLSHAVSRLGDKVGCWS